MRHPRIIIAGLGLAAVATVGGVTAAAATGSPAGGAPPAASATGSPSGGAPPAAPASAAGPRGAATVRTVVATVGGRTEAILVNAHGLPLYYYRPDRATRSLVTGGLARLWPPLTSAAPTAVTRVTGKLTVVRDAHGDQVAYNGHLLYTFTGDRAGQVTGQGFQNFFVATAGLTPAAKSPVPGTTVPAVPSGGYGY
jgi:predicted lipoprotein with Yx(FWY)xxD motif